MSEQPHLLFPTPGHDGGTTQVITPKHAEEYLRQMDISVPDIGASLEHGEYAAQNVSEFAPPTAAGLARWMRTVETMRERLAESGTWTYRNDQNRPTMDHESGRYTLSFALGDDQTANSSAYASPRAARKRGKATQAAIEGNQPALFDLHHPSRAADDFTGSSAPLGGNWFLLYRRAEGEIRREISLPHPSLHEDNFAGWQVRIILDPLNLDETIPQAPDIGGDDVDFDIRLA